MPSSPARLNSTPPRRPPRTPTRIVPRQPRFQPPPVTARASAPATNPTTIQPMRPTARTLLRRLQRREDDRVGTIGVPCKVEAAATRDEPELGPECRTEDIGCRERLLVEPCDPRHEKRAFFAVGARHIDLIARMKL